MSNGYFTFSLFVIIVSVLLFLYVRIQITKGKARIAQQKLKEHLALQLHPTYRQKVEEDRAFALETRRLALAEQETQAKIQIMLAEFEHRRYLEVTRVQPETYILDYKPQSITALPSLKRIATPEPKDEKETTIPIYEQPELTTFIEELTPNALEFIYGLDPRTGELAKTTLPKAVHIQLLGASGQGKSRQATSILTQLTARNDTNHLQLALIDCEGETTQPFQHLPHVRHLADEPKEAVKILRNLTGELERRDKVKVIYPVILIFVEEFLNLRRTMPEAYRDQALEDYTTLALRGRKRGMFLFSIGQTAYTERAIRDAQAQFLSSMAFAVKPTAARAAGFTNTDLLNRLYSERRPGQFLLERPVGDSILLAPYVEPRSVALLLSDRETSSENGYHLPVIESSLKDSRDQNRNQIDTALQAKLAHVCQLLTQGTTNKADIMLPVWGVKPGNSEKYKTAEAEYKQIMAYLAQQSKTA